MDESTLPVIQRRTGSFSNAPATNANVNSPVLTSKDSFLVSLDAWIVQKLKHQWSSNDLGSLLTKDKLSDTVSLFRHLETPIKVRLLLSCLCMRKDELQASKLIVVQLVDAAERDNDEWVKIGAGLVKQYLFTKSHEDNDASFLQDTMTKTMSKILQAVEEQSTKKKKKKNEFEDVFLCSEHAYLNPSVRPEVPVKPTMHFTVSEVVLTQEEELEERSAHQKKQPLHRTPQIPRPSVHTSSVTNSGGSTSSSSASRLTPTTTKPLPLPPKKNLTELSSEIRRKADAGRFKRHRSRISMIDIDEVKQIESEKAQKAEERKKQKKEKHHATSATTDATADSVHDGHEHDSQALSGHASPEDGQDEQHHQSEEDDQVAGSYAPPPSGTQALLNAAFQMHEAPIGSHAPRGFEPEDAQQPHFGYGFAPPTDGCLDEQSQEQQQQPPEYWR